MIVPAPSRSGHWLETISEWFQGSGYDRGTLNLHRTLRHSCLGRRNERLVTLASGRMRFCAAAFEELDVGF